MAEGCNERPLFGEPPKGFGEKRGSWNADFDSPPLKHWSISVECSLLEDKCTMRV